MSLECEGRGAVCDECGHFNFLTTRCGRCEGVFCQRHAQRHHTPREGGPSAGVAGPWCGPPAVLPLPPTGAPGPASPAGPKAAQEPPDESRPRAPVSGRGPGGEGGKGEGRGPAGASPLVLAPPGYTGGLVGLVVVVALPGPDAPEAWALDVHRVLFAAESALGQLVERCLEALGLPGGGQGGRPERASLWRIVAHYDEAAGGGGTRAGRATFPTQTPSLRLDSRSLAALARDSLSSGDVVVLLTTDFPNDCARGLAISLLSEALGDLFFPPHRRYAGLAKNQFVLAAATRLRLQAQARLSASSSPSIELDRVGTTSTPEQRAPDVQEDHPDRARGAVEVNHAPANSSTGAVSHASSTPLTTQRSDDVALPLFEWPFRTPPPLSKFRFSNNKVNPRGVKEASGHGRIVVAVFVEDALLQAAVAPFCIALWQQWRTGKLMERVKEEESASSGLPLDAFSAYDVFILTSDPPKKLKREDRSVPISNGDVLLLGKSEHCEDVSATSTGDIVKRAVVQELDRMRQLKGKEQAELRLEMMKKCALM